MDGLLERLARFGKNSLPRFERACREPVTLFTDRAGSRIVRNEWTPLQAVVLR